MVQDRPTRASARAPLRRSRGRAGRALVCLLALVAPFVAGCQEGLLPPEELEQVGDEGVVEDGEAGKDGDDVEPEPDGSGADAFPNRPEGLREITEIGFSSLDEDGWRATDEVSRVADPSAPRSPDAVGEILFPEGWTGGYAPAWTTKGIEREQARELYLSFWVKLSENWQGHHVGDKIGYAWIHGNPSFYPLYVGRGSSRMRSQIKIQGVPGGAHTYDPNLTDPEIVRGRWHRWEIVLVSNSGGAADGEIHWWIDGEKAGEYRDVRFGSAGQSEIWETVTWRPIWGGRGGEIQQDQRMWMDHIYVAGR